MARLFDGNDYIDFGNIFSFSHDAAWTSLIFVRQNAFSDDHVLVGKWGGVSTNNQFLLYVDSPARNVELFHNNASRCNGSVIANDTWYLVAGSNDGSGNLKLYTLRLSDMVFLDDAVSGTSTANVSDLTSEVSVGARNLSATITDFFEGDAAAPCIVNGELTKEEIVEYAINPLRAMVHFKARHGLTVYTPLGLASPEPDYSGNGNSGTVTGATVGTNPPTAHFGAGAFFVPSVAAAAGGEDENVGDLIAGQQQPVIELSGMVPY